MSIGDKLLGKFRIWKTDSQPVKPDERAVEEAATPRNFVDFDTRDYMLDTNSKDKENTTQENKEKTKQENGTDKDTKIHTNHKDAHEVSAKFINVVNSSHVHVGTNVTNYLNGQTEEAREEVVEKTPEIVAIMRSTDMPEYSHLNCISRNLGKRWKGFFRSLGYSDGFIETIQEQEGGFGLHEVRYKLLLDWKRNDKDGTIGALTSSLWRDGHCGVVRELAALAE